MAPKYVRVLIPRTCEYVILHGKRDLAGVIKMGRIALMIQVDPV